MMNVKILRKQILIFGFIFIQNTYAGELIVDAKNEGDFSLLSEALNFIDSNKLTTPAPIEQPASGSSVTTWDTATLVSISDNISNFSGYSSFSDGLLVKFEGDNYWYSARYLTKNALTLSERAHKNLNGVAWEFAVKTPYDINIRNGIYADSGTKPIAPFVTIRGESQRGVLIDTNGGGNRFEFNALCKEATLENFSIIPSGPGRGSSLGMVNNSDNSPYVNWVLRKMYIDVHHAKNVDTIGFFSQTVNSITIEDSHIEGNFHVLTFFGVTGANLRNNTIVSHIIGTSWSVAGLVIITIADESTNIIVENNNFVIIGDESLSTQFNVTDFTGIYLQLNNGSIWNGSIANNTFKIASFNDDSTDITSGITIKIPDSYDGSATWNVLIDQNQIEVDSRNSQECHFYSDIAINGGTIISGDEQPVNRCGLAY